MRVICVDDEPLAVEYTLGQCALLPEISEAKGFTQAQSALDWLREHSADLAILDINMPEIDGITLAARIKELYPQLLTPMPFTRLGTCSNRCPSKSWRRKCVTRVQEYINYPMRIFRSRLSGYLTSM